MLLIPILLWASQPQVFKLSPDTGVVNIDLFMSTTCPHCQKALVYLEGLQQQNPWIRLHQFPINTDETALGYFSKRLASMGYHDFLVPSIFFCSTRWVGFSSAETTGKDLWKMLDFCHQKLLAKGELSLADQAVLAGWAQTSLFKRDVSDGGNAGLMVPALALIDAFNPCALYVLMLVLALMILSPDAKTRRGLVLTMLVVIVLLHALQQNFLGLYYQTLVYLRYPAIAAGLILFMTVLQGKALWMGLSASYSLAIIMMYQQSCLINWSLYFEQWISLHNPHWLPHLFLELFYQAFYVLPLILLLYLANKIFSKSSRFFSQVKLNYIGMLYLFACGCLLLVYPKAFAGFLGSLFALVLLSMLGWLIGWFRERMVRVCG